MKTYDVLILGGGPAGYTAALYAARAGLDTVVIEKTYAGGQMTQTAGIENYPGFESVDGITLGATMQAAAERFGAQTVMEEATRVLLPAGVKQVFASGGEYRGRTLIIATGSAHRPLGLSNESALTGRGVSYCAACDGRLYADRTVTVIGGGNTAATDALYLSRFCKKVYLVHRRDTLRASRTYHSRLSEAENVEFKWNCVVDEFIAGDMLEAVRLRDVKTGETAVVPVDGAFVSIGRNPETALFRDLLAMDGTGHIIAGEDTRTSVPGVFVAGDARAKEVRQIVTATADGAVAAYQAEKFITEGENR